VKQLFVDTSAVVALAFEGPGHERVRELLSSVPDLFARGYTRGADAWHLATALFLVQRPEDLPFLTFDRRQQAVARALGYPVPEV
jgi:hypothetical protein